MGWSNTCHIKFTAPSQGHSSRRLLPSTLDSLRWPLGTKPPPLTTHLQVKPIPSPNALGASVRQQRLGLGAAQLSSPPRVLVFWNMLCMAEIRSVSWMLKTWNCRWGREQGVTETSGSPSQGPEHSVGPHGLPDLWAFLPQASPHQPPRQVYPPGALSSRALPPTQVSLDEPGTKEAPPGPW